MIFAPLHSLTPRLALLPRHSIDRDHSHSISREEFIVFCKNSPEVSTYFSKVDEMRTELTPIITANNKLADFRKVRGERGCNV